MSRNFFLIDWPNVRVALRPLLFLAALLTAATLAAARAGAVDAPKNANTHAPVKHEAPTWAQLSAEQKEALAPLADDWDKFDPPRKKKWLDIAVRYKDLSPEGQQKMHERMPELARLTPEQRTTARENFKRAYELPAQKRRELTQQFQDLPEDKKRELAEQAHKNGANVPRRPGATVTGTGTQAKRKVDAAVAPREGAAATPEAPPPASPVR